MERCSCPALAFLGLVFAIQLVLLNANDNLETYTLYFRKGEEKVPVHIELDLKEKTAHVYSENPDSTAAISLYDYKARAIAFKDDTNKTCFIERMHDPSLVYERRLIRSLRNQVLFGTPETLYATAPSLTKRQILTRGGKKIFQFCKNAKTFTISGKWKSEAALRKKRDLQNGYLQRSYSHHEQLTQSYAKFGHEHLTYQSANSHPLIKRAFQAPPSYLFPSDSQSSNLYKSDSSHNLQNSDHFKNFKKSRHITIDKNTDQQKANSASAVNPASVSRITREAPKNNRQIAPVYLRAGGETSQIYSHINSNPASSTPGFTATGRFGLANTHINGYGNGQLAAQGRASTGYGGGDLNADYQKSFVPQYGSNGGYGGQMPPSGSQLPSYSSPGSMTSGRGSSTKSAGHQLPQSTNGNSGYYAGGQPRNGHFQPSKNGYPNGYGNQQGHGQSNGLHHGGQTGPATDFSRYSPLAQNGHIPQQGKQTGLSSQSQIDVLGSQINAGASAQGALHERTAQTQVQGQSSQDGSFQAQAQSGSGYGSSQSQTQGSETGAQSSSNTHIKDLGQSQSQAQLSLQNRMAQANAQTSSQQGLTGVQSQGSAMGGQASSQAQGFSGMPSSANAGVTFDGAPSSNPQANGYTGHVSANSHGGLQEGQSLTQVRGSLQSGSPYTASAQSNYGMPPETSGGPLAVAMPGSGQQDYLIPHNGRTLAQQGLPQPASAFQPGLDRGTAQQFNGRQHVVPGFNNGQSKVGPIQVPQYPGAQVNNGARRTHIPSYPSQAHGFQPRAPTGLFPSKPSSLGQQPPGSSTLQYPAVPASQYAPSVQQGQYAPPPDQIPKTGSLNGHPIPSKSQTHAGPWDPNFPGLHGTSSRVPSTTLTNGRGTKGNGIQNPAVTSHQPSVPFHNGQAGKSHSAVHQPTPYGSNGHFPVNSQNVRNYPGTQTGQRMPMSQSPVNPSTGFGTSGNCDSTTCLQGFRIIKSVNICMLPAGCH